jgi:site-specific DNA recombinase
MGMGRAAYERLSRNRGKRSPSIANQRFEIKEYFERNGWPFDESLNFSDDDISAAKYETKERPGYNALLAAIRAALVHMIVVTEMTRLFRQVPDLLELHAIVLELHVRSFVIETTSGERGGARYDLMTNQGFHDALDAVVDGSRESGKISDRVRRAKRARAREGRWHGGNRPYGYERETPIFDAEGNITNRGRLVVVESEAAIIRGLTARILNGEALTKIAADLNEREVPTATGNGRLWHPATIRNLFRSKRIAGIREDEGAEYPASWPAIISVEDWERVSLVLGDAARYVGAAKKGVRSYLLTGIIECGICGADGETHVKLYPGAMWGKQRIKQRKYACKTLDHYGRQVGCGKIVRLADPVEALVSEAVLARFESEDLAALVAPEAPAELHELAAQLVEDRRRLEQANQDRYRRADDPLRLDRRDFARVRAEIEDAMESVQRRMARLEQGRTLASIPIGKTLREAWYAADLGWRRTVLSLVVERVKLLPGHPGSRLWPTEDDEHYEDILKHYPDAPWRFDGSRVVISWKV